MGAGGSVEMHFGGWDDDTSYRGDRRFLTRPHKEPLPLHSLFNPTIPFTLLLLLLHHISHVTRSEHAHRWQVEVPRCRDETNH